MRTLLVLAILVSGVACASLCAKVPIPVLCSTTSTTLP
jgi:hypothetical protein